MANDLPAPAVRPPDAPVRTRLRAPPGARSVRPLCPCCSRYAPVPYGSDGADCDDCDVCNGDTGATEDGPEAWVLGGGGLAGGGVAGAVGVLGGGVAGGVTGWSGRVGEGFGRPGRPPCPAESPGAPPAPGSGPDGCTGWDGSPGSDGSASSFPAFFLPLSSPSAGRPAPWWPIRRGPPPWPSTVTPPGPDSPPFPSCRAAEPEGLGFSSGSLTLIQPASDTASAETATAAETARECLRRAVGRDGAAGPADDEDGVGVGGEG